ncbi:MAG: DUF4147 domain-containing protein [Chloroflexota bacterium]
MTQRIENREALTSHGNQAGRRAMVEILEAGLQATDPYDNTTKLIRLEGDRLIVGGSIFEPAGAPKTGDEVFDLTKIRNIYVFGAGKGIQRVAKAVEDALGERLTGGWVVDKKGHAVICRKVGVTLGAHPAPDIDCVRGCEKIYAMIKEKVRSDDLVFTCVANGVSSLLTMPAPGLNIDDVSEVTRVLQIQHGAPTGDVNAIRNHVDMMKGGRISRYIHPAKAVHIIAHVPSTWERLTRHNLWLHSLPDYTTFQTAIDSINKFDAWNEIPASVKDFLLRADPAWESVKTEEFESWGNRIFCVMPGGKARRPQLPAAMEKAAALGFQPVIMTDELHGIDARQAGIYVASVCRAIERAGYPFEPPCALFSCGEMLVTVGKETGIGGRNQEFALSAAQFIAGSKNIVIGSVDTDGTDGPGIQYTPEKFEDMPPCLAGGITDGETIAQAAKTGVNIVEEMKRHNTSPALWRLKSGVAATPSISMADLTAALVMGRSAEK